MSTAATVSYGCAEFFQKTFDFNQTVKQLPVGTYKFCAQGFQRPGRSVNSYNDYVAGSNNVNAEIYAGAKKVKLAHIASEAQTKKLGGAESTVGDNRYIPNNMQAASIYFGKGLYENSVENKIVSDNGSLKLGIKSTSMPEAYWVIFDNFRLYSFGNTMYDPETGVSMVNSDGACKRNDRVFTLDGRQLPVNSRLRPGLYIRNGKKFLVK